MPLVSKLGSWKKASIQETESVLQQLIGTFRRGPEVQIEVNSPGDPWHSLPWTWLFRKRAPGDGGGSTEQEGGPVRCKTPALRLAPFAGSGQVGRAPPTSPEGVPALKKPREDEQSPDWGGKEGEGREGVWEGGHS